MLGLRRTLRRVATGLGGIALVACHQGSVQPVGPKTEKRIDVRWVATAVGEGAYFDYSCGLTDTGAAYCWGDNSSGQLGSPTPAEQDGSREPLPVLDAPPFKAIAAGWRHTCGLSVEGVAYCWGQAGIADTGSTVPVPMPGAITLVAFTASNFRTCGLTPDGRAYCWSGGDADPQAVPGGLVFKALSAGVNFQCGVTLDGTGWCWGANGRHQLGDGQFTDRTEPTPVAGNHSFELIATGGDQACGLAVGGAVYCWGEVGGATPVLIDDTLRLTTVTVGNSHACGLTEAGAAYCWGRNDLGQLGDGTSERAGGPVAVFGGHPFVTIAAGGDNTCATTGNGEAWCWGFNGHGQLGDGSSPASSVYEDFSRIPVRVVNPRS